MSSFLSKQYFPRMVTQVTYSYESFPELGLEGAKFYRSVASFESVESFESVASSESVAISEKVAISKFRIRSSPRWQCPTSDFLGGYWRWPPQKSEVGSRKSEIGSRKLEIGNQNSGAPEADYPAPKYMSFYPLCK